MYVKCHMELWGIDWNSAISMEKKHDDEGPLLMSHTCVSVSVTVCSGMGVRCPMSAFLSSVSLCVL